MRQEERPNNKDQIPLPLGVDTRTPEEIAESMRKENEERRNSQTQGPLDEARSTAQKDRKGGLSGQKH